MSLSEVEVLKLKLRLMEADLKAERAELKAERLETANQKLQAKLREKQLKDKHRAELARERILANRERKALKKQLKDADIQIGSLHQQVVKQLAAKKQLKAQKHIAKHSIYTIPKPEQTKRNTATYTLVNEEDSISLHSEADRKQLAQWVVNVMKTRMAATNSRKEVCSLYMKCDVLDKDGVSLEDDKYVPLGTNDLKKGEPLYDMERKRIAKNTLELLQHNLLIAVNHYANSDKTLSLRRMVVSFST